METLRWMYSLSHGLYQEETGIKQISVGFLEKKANLRVTVTEPVTSRNLSNLKQSKPGRKAPLLFAGRYAAEKYVALFTEEPLGKASLKARFYGLKARLLDCKQN